jgi:7-cyano-7-deazaguanine synthase
VVSNPSDPTVAPAAVLLLSGGLDSYTAGAIAAGEGFRLHALTVRYGQRHARELDAARAVAASLQVIRHIEIEVDLAAFGGSSLTTDAPVPKDRPIDPKERRSGVPEGQAEIPSTYVPARNTVFLSLALAWAEVLGAHDIFIGVNALDYSGYPDCRPEYIEAFERLASLATARGVRGERFRIHAPLQHLTKADIIRRGLSLGLDYALTHSGYDPAAARPCGHCDSCILRAAGFAQLGMADPADRAGTS